MLSLDKLRKKLKSNKIKDLFTKTEREMMEAAMEQYRKLKSREFKKTQ